ncbi:MAG: hypothetical protein PUP91_05290 [Rhizonema sp. PD37]|nr:hypothetical protein [Rhizonema sp. PD37]
MLSSKSCLKFQEFYKINGFGVAYLGEAIAISLKAIVPDSYMLLLSIHSNYCIFKLNTVGLLRIAIRCDFSDGDRKSFDKIAINPTSRVFHHLNKTAIDTICIQNFEKTA